MADKLELTREEFEYLWADYQRVKLNPVLCPADATFRQYAERQIQQKDLQIASQYQLPDGIKIIP